jgi:hypothetical protein
MFWKNRKVVEAAAIDAHVRLMAIEALLPYAMAGRVPTAQELMDAVMAHPDMKEAAIYGTTRQAASLISRAERLVSR